MATLERGASVNVAPNLAARLAPWALALQARGRFEDGGRGPDAFDCMGLAVYAQALVGRAARDYLDLYEDLDIRATGDVDALMRAYGAAWVDVHAGDVGDVLVLGSGRRAHHTAVLCGAGRAIHANAGAGLTIGELGGRIVQRFAGMSVFGLVRPG
jgi:cell wall-associated NlpC family hydrolase